MAGFLGKYDILQTVYLDAEKKWWVKYVPSLSGACRDSLRDRFAVTQTTPDGLRYQTTVPDDKLLTNKREQTLMSIREWNLTDAQDVVLPFDFDWEAELKPDAPPSGLRVSWGRLPYEVQDLIAEAIAKSDEAAPPAKDARFQDGSDGGVADGDHEASDDRESVG